MTGVKRLVALLLLVAVGVGVWLLLRPSPASDILISDAKAAPDAQGMRITLRITNSGGADSLIAAGSSGADGRIVSVEGKDRLPIPAGSAPVLSLDGAYVELFDLTDAEAGQLIPVTLVFERAGAVTAQALVVPADPQAMHMEHMAHMDQVEVPADRPAPEVDLTVTADGIGWAVQVEMQNFTLNEDMADGPHVPGVGHAHLYLDGIKLQRLYHRDAHIGALPPGRYTLRVTLNSNDHRLYAKDGAPIIALTTLEVP